MTDVHDVHAQLRAINQSAAFNQWCGLEVKLASAGQVELVMPWRAEFGQYTGFLHAGLIGTLIDTANTLAELATDDMLAGRIAVVLRRGAAAGSELVVDQPALGGGFDDEGHDRLVQRVRLVDRQRLALLGFKAR